MPRPGNKIRIPIEERDAIAGLLAVKPTKDMPRPGASAKPKKQVKRTKKSDR